MHPATKNWYTIDYVMTRLDQKNFCIDAGVAKGANCWTDHSLVRATIRLDKKVFNHRTCGRPIPLAGHRLRDVSIRKKYSEKLTNILNERPFSSVSQQTRTGTPSSHVLLHLQNLQLVEAKESKPDWFI